MSKAKSLGVRIHVLGVKIDGRANLVELADLARKSGGSYRRPDWLGKVGSLAFSLSKQHVITLKAAKDFNGYDAPVRITVKVTRPGVEGEATVEGIKVGLRKGGEKPPDDAAPVVLRDSRLARCADSLRTFAKNH